MWAIARATLLIICLSQFAGAQTGSLAFYTGKADGLNDSAFRSAQQELDRLLVPAGIDIAWRSLATRTPDEQFDRVVVVSFDGSCSLPDAAAQSGKFQDSRITLADSSVSNGSVLPFIRVDCTNLLHILSPALRPMSSKERNTAFGRALGRVMAHELYHIVGETTSHQTIGVAKASLSVQDLIGVSLDFDTASLTQMRPTLPPAAPVSLARSYTRPARDLVPGEEKVREP
jgi:hypothetical protein